MYKVIEQFRQGKRSMEACEDGLVITPAWVAVIDGSTSKGDFNWGKKTSGQLARDIIAGQIRQLPPEADITLILKILTAALNERTVAVTGKTAEDIPAYNRLTASVVLYSDLQRTVWQIGDCPFLTDGVLHDNSKPREAELASRRAAVIHEKLEEGQTVNELKVCDPGRAAILDDLRKECLSQNKTFSVLDGTPVYQPGITSTDVSACKELVLASDGYPVLCHNLEESERKLEILLQDDPLCINRFKATKGLKPGFQSFDDRTYVRLRLFA